MIERLESTTTERQRKKAMERMKKLLKKAKTKTSKA
jgi:hypothetical protein